MVFWVWIFLHMSKGIKFVFHEAASGRACQLEWTCISNFRDCRRMPEHKLLWCKKNGWRSCSAPAIIWLTKNRQCFLSSRTIKGKRSNLQIQYMLLKLIYICIIEHAQCWHVQNIPNEGTKEVLNNVESLTEERIDEVLNKFLKDLKEGSLEKEGWPTHLSAYILSKASMNAYTRILAKKYQAFLVNCVCPGYVKTDITCYTGLFNAAEGAQSPVRLALLPHAGPSGFFYSRGDQLSCFWSKMNWELWFDNETLWFCKMSSCLNFKCLS